MNRIVDLWKIKTYFEIENPSSNCAIRSFTLPWNLFSAFCDQSKGKYILHKNCLEMTDQLTLSITKPSQVHDKISFFIYYKMNPLYELNKNGSLRSDWIFNHREKWKNQSLWVLLNIIDKADDYLDQIIDKQLSQIDSKNCLEIGTPFNNYRTEALGWYESIKYNIDNRYSENLLNRFYFINRLSRNLKDQILIFFIENENLNNVTKDTIDRHSSSWKKFKREWFNHSIIRIDKHINRNLNVYKWSNQTEYFIKYFKQVFSKNNYFKIVFDPIELCTNTNQDSIGWSMFFSLSESTVKILNSKFDILIYFFDFAFHGLQSNNYRLLNQLLDPTITWTQINDLVIFTQ